MIENIDSLWEAGRCIHVLKLPQTWGETGVRMKISRFVRSANIPQDGILENCQFGEWSREGCLGHSLLYKSGGVVSKIK